MVMCCAMTWRMTNPLNVEWYSTMNKQRTVLLNIRRNQEAFIVKNMCEGQGYEKYVKALIRLELASSGLRAYTMAAVAAGLLDVDRSLVHYQDDQKTLKFVRPRTRTSAPPTKDQEERAKVAVLNHIETRCVMLSGYSSVIRKPIRCRKSRKQLALEESKRFVSR